MPVPAAQLHTTLQARLALFAGCDPVAARDTELGLRASFGGDPTPLAGGRALLTLVPHGLVLSALKPAARGDGIVARVLNPTDVPLDAELVFGIPVRAVAPVRLDEEPDSWPVTAGDGRARFTVPPHALRSLHLAV
jgi:alpha-mannosidase